MSRPRYAATHHVLIRPAPCDGCAHREACGSLRLACGAFAEWARFGRMPELTDPREPTRARWERLYGSGGAALTPGHHEPPKSRENACERVLDTGAGVGAAAQADQRKFGGEAAPQNR